MFDLVQYNLRIPQKYRPACALQIICLSLSLSRTFFSSTVVQVALTDAYAGLD